MNTFTQNQRAAIESDAPRIMAIAGPGSGKTATVVARIKRIIRERCGAEEVAAITYTNAAAGELARRIEKDDGAVDEIKSPLGFTGTLHAFCLRMLKEHGEGVGYGSRMSLISPESAVELLASKARTVACKTPISELVKRKSLGRPAINGVDKAAITLASYFDDLKEMGIVDYDALLHEFRNALNSDGGLELQARIHERFSHLFVDEVQDLSPLDWEILRALPIRNKFYVGDPDQAIFGFRGGDVAETIKEVGEPGVHAVALEENFRSTPEICATAQRLIENNATRAKKTTRAVRTSVDHAAQGLHLAPTEHDEVAFVAREILSLIDANAPDKRSIAVLARTNAIAKVFRDGLPRFEVPVVATTRTQLPPDWRFARSFVEFLADPENDALAYLYLVARLEQAGNRDPKAAAHEKRRQASAGGKTLNASLLNVPRVADPKNALLALKGQASGEAYFLACEKFRELPASATMLELTLALAEVREFDKEEPDAEGVHVLTIHSAKGREFDSVFLVGFEDGTIPGRNDEGRELEEERRLAYVAITRARNDLVVSHVASRTLHYGPKAVIKAQKPSRFLKEMFG